MNYSSTEDLGEVMQRGSGIKRNAAISVLDARGLPVSIELTVQYKLEPSTAPQTIATWGMSWEDKIINPVVRDVTRSVIGNSTQKNFHKNVMTLRLILKMVSVKLSMHNQVSLLSF